MKRLLVTCAVLRCFPRAVCEGEADVWHEIAVEGFCGGGIARRQQSHGMARLERCKGAVALLLILVTVNLDHGVPIAV